MILTFITVGLIIVILVTTYNSLVKKRNEVENAESSVDVILKKRYDLIPNLVASVKQFMEHEKELLMGITKLRSQILEVNSNQGHDYQLENKMSGLLGSLNVAMENYPDLKSTSNVLQLQASLNEVEEQISAARRNYNQSVTDLNNGVQTFPNNIIAKAFGFKKAKTFDIPMEQKENVSVKNLFNS